MYLLLTDLAEVHETLWLWLQSIKSCKVETRKVFKHIVHYVKLA